MIYSLYNNWQHEDTGGIVRLPFWKNPGQRYYKIKKGITMNFALLKFHWCKELKILVILEIQNRAFLIVEKSKGKVVVHFLFCIN